MNAKEAKKLVKVKVKSELCNLPDIYDIIQQIDIKIKQEASQGYTDCWVNLYEKVDIKTHTSFIKSRFLTSKIKSHYRKLGFKIQDCNDTTLISWK